MNSNSFALPGRDNPERQCCRELSLHRGSEDWLSRMVCVISILEYCFRAALVAHFSVALQPLYKLNLPGRFLQKPPRKMIYHEVPVKYGKT